MAKGQQIFNIYHSERKQHFLDCINAANPGDIFAFQMDGKEVFATVTHSTDISIPPKLGLSKKEGDKAILSEESNSQIWKRTGVKYGGI